MQGCKDFFKSHIEKHIEKYVTKMRFTFLFYAFNKAY